MNILLYPLRLLLALAVRHELVCGERWMKSAVREGVRHPSVLSKWGRKRDELRCRIALLIRPPRATVLDVLLAVAIGVLLACACVYGWPL